MGAIFFPFALKDEFHKLVDWLVSVAVSGGWSIPEWLMGSAIFFAVILLFQIGYYFMVLIQALYSRMDKQLLLPLFGYGFIPLILGGYMSLHLEFFVKGAGRIVPNIEEMLGQPHSYENIRLISSDSTFVLQFITVLGGLLASLYATYRVIDSTPSWTFSINCGTIFYSNNIILLKKIPINILHHISSILVRCINLTFQR